VCGNNFFRTYNEFLSDLVGVTKFLLIWNKLQEHSLLYLPGAIRGLKNIILLNTMSSSALSVDPASLQHILDPNRNPIKSNLPVAGHPIK
jgi:hypothetical protein